jgi:hypothetical protein
MVTVFPLMVQDPVASIVGVMPALELVVTTKVERYVALAGAPLKVTVCAISRSTIVVSVMVGAGRKEALPDWLKVTVQAPILPPMM